MNQHPRRENLFSRREGIGVSVASLLILVAGAVWALAELDFGSGIGLMGVAVSTAGLIVAILIFLNQKRHSDASEERILNSIEAKARGQASKDEPADEQDAYEAETRVLERLGKNVGDGVLRVRHGDIPLKLIRDAVVGWEKAGVSGSWTLDVVLSALRRKGKGNHAWWLVARDPRTEQERVFKISRGGRGNDGATDVTVTEVT